MRWPWTRGGDDGRGSDGRSDPGGTYPTEREGDTENRFIQRMRERPGGGGPWSRDAMAARRGHPDDRIDAEERRGRGGGNRGGSGRG